MKKLTLTLAGALLATAGIAHAETFKWASATDPQTMDPHAVNSAPVLGFLNNVYEGLVRLSRDVTLEPALATSWEPIGDGQGWRFNLRQGVTFHDGSAFTARDVVFSYERASSEQADTRSWFAPVSEVVMVDEYTVDIMTSAPNPVLPESIANWMMMDSGWAAANDAERPDKEEGNFATLNANGTGAFRLVERQPGLMTALEPFDDWWGEAEHNITRAEFTPVQNPATRVAALVSGELDMIEPVPIQDADRVDERDGIRVIRGVESRVIMLGFAHEADALKYTAQAGAPNPFRDVRVRRAVAQAVDVEAILQTIMRGNAEPVSQLVTPAMRGFSRANAARPAFDPDAARALLAEAGYRDGFSFGLKCPNNRYLSDEAVCQAVVSMLARVGITAELDAMPPENWCGYWSMRVSGLGMPTRSSSSTARLRAAPPPRSRWVAIVSTSCSPTVKSGLSEVSGSWKIIDTRRPRMARMAASSVPEIRSPSRSIVPPVMRPRPSRRPMTAAPTVDLPAPLSPTRPWIWPGWTVSAASRTAVKGSRRVGNWTVRSRMERRGDLDGSLAIIVSSHRRSLQFRVERVAQPVA